MKLNNLPNLRVEDFPPDQGKWLQRLFIQLNPFFQSLNQVLELGVDYLSNIKSVTREYQITTFQSFSFQWTHKDSAPADLRVIQATKGSQATPVVLLAAWSYNSTNQTVTVTDLLEASSSGVSAVSGSYKFNIRVTV